MEALLNAFVTLILDFIKAPPGWLRSKNDIGLMKLITTVITSNRNELSRRTRYDFVLENSFTDNEHLFFCLTKNSRTASISIDKVLKEY